MTQQESWEKPDFVDVFKRKTKEIFSLDTNQEMVGELAYSNYKKHFGCSQSMFHAFQEVLGFRDDFWFKALGALQGGGSCGLTCGALVTGLILIGATVGRDNIDDGFKGILPVMKPSWTLTNWFKLMWKSTVCSEISGVNWFDMNEIIEHYRSPRGIDTVEQCAKLTGGTAYKVAEILSQL
ncbi:C-GCAxxG-C-C family protein [Chloroflexota bacterium]